MQSFTPYLWIIVSVVILFGFWIPALGYVVPIVFAGAFIFGLKGGRWMCGNVCPRGSFNDFVLSKFSRNKKIPAILRSLWIRIPIIGGMMMFMMYRIIQTNGVFNQVGMVFVSMCLLTTVIAVIMGVGINPRAWCVFCPMGTIQRFLGSKKKQITVNPALCVDCSICEKACPMQLDCKDMNKPDCIKCERCITCCPKKALEIKK